jgi:cytochrome bd-type quinol oxidase subunit 1
MPFQIGINWSRYADTAGNVLGPLFAYEALTAFFLEAAFLGVLLTAAVAGRGANGRLSIGIFSSIAAGFVRELMRAFFRDHQA